MVNRHRGEGRTLSVLVFGDTELINKATVLIYEKLVSLPPNKE